ncbi:MAG: response regulator [Calditrichaeota bacterium]|nr:response regulator [Calditrichota bacterium]
MGKDLILLIDDDPEMQRLAKRVFGDPVYDLRIAETAEEGLRKLREVNPDIIILDFALPDFDGEEFVEIIRYDPNYAKWSTVPILMLTARAEFYGRAERFFGMGVLAFLVKPFGRHELLNIVDNLIRRSRYEKRFGRVPQAPAKPVSPVPAEELEESISTIAGLTKAVLERQPCGLSEDQRLDLSAIYNRCRSLLRMMAAAQGGNGGPGKNPFGFGMAGQTP